MSGSPTFFEALGLPDAVAAAATRQRMRERVQDLITQGEVPWPSKTAPPRPPGDELAQCTGLPTYADVFGGTECFRAWAEEHLDQTSEEPDEDWDLPWWIVGAGIAGWAVWELLDQPITLDSGDLEWEIDGFEIDGIPWTVDRMHPPGPPRAARVADPLVHGGAALPGPGATGVFIGGRRALTVTDTVAACPMCTTLGVQHCPQKIWTTTNTSVTVNGELLLRAGDWVTEMPGGPNPIVDGMPSVLVGPPGNPVMVQEERYVGLDYFVDDLEVAGWSGGKLTIGASISWNLQDALIGATAFGLSKLGKANPFFAPLTGWAAGKLFDVMDKPKIENRSSLDTGSLFAEKRKDFENSSPIGPRHKTTRDRYELELPNYKGGESAEIDPKHSWPPIHKNEKGEWEVKPMNEGPQSTDEDDIEWGPFRKRSQTHDSNEPPTPWEDDE